MTLFSAKTVFIGGVIVACTYISTQLQDARQRNAPASDWMEVRSVAVSDAVEGNAPALNVDRIIKREFVALWTVDVRSVEPVTGATSVVCSSTGISAYLPTSQPLTGKTLDFWTAPRHCRPPPGRYRVDVIWMIRDEGGAGRARAAG